MKEPILNENQLAMVDIIKKYEPLSLSKLTEIYRESQQWEESNINSVIEELLCRGVIANKNGILTITGSEKNQEDRKTDKKEQRMSKIKFRVSCLLIGAAIFLMAGFFYLKMQNRQTSAIPGKFVSEKPAIPEKAAVAETEAKAKVAISPVPTESIPKSDSAKEKVYQENEVGYFSKNPVTADYSWIAGERNSLPEASDFGYDIRSADLSEADLTGDYDKLLQATFDSKTKWPDKLPEGFDPDKIMALYKNPGLNIRNLHDQGITGKGVGIAIIDQPLLTDHVEYKDQLKYYYADPNVLNQEASMHGPSVASIAVGKNVGVAPEADLYYVATDFSNAANDNTPVTEAINRLLDLNETIPQQNKIRVISISWGWDDETAKGNDKLKEAYARAKKEGVFVITTSLYKREDMSFSGLTKIPLSDADDFNSYIENKYMLEMTYNISTPMNLRCVASPTGTTDYAVFSEGGLSWSVPYLAGLYALACQVKPEITYNEFWKLAAKTARTSSGTYNGKPYQAKYIADPVAIIKHLQEE